MMRPRRAGALRAWLRRSGPPAALLLTLALAWEAAVRGLAVPAFILPPPSAILAALWDYREPLLLTHLPVTLGEVLLGFFLSLACGAGLAVTMHFFPPLARALYPLVVVSQTIPFVAISPVFLLWFGYSIWQKAAVIVLIGFFAVCVATYDGLRSADPELLDLLSAAGATRWQVFRTVQIPSALPLFFSGARVAAAVSIIGAVIGEWLGGDAGLGIFGRRMASQVRAAPLFASVLLLSLAGLALFAAVSGIERRLLPWHHRQPPGGAAEQ